MCVEGRNSWSGSGEGCGFERFVVGGKSQKGFVVGAKVACRRGLG